MRKVVVPGELVEAIERLAAKGHRPFDMQVAKMLHGAVRQSSGGKKADKPTGGPLFTVFAAEEADDDAPSAA